MSIDNRSEYTSQDQAISQISNNEEKTTFKGTWAPKELHDLIKSKQISLGAAWLALNISSLSSGKNNKEQRCWATNKFLGKIIGRTKELPTDLIVLCYLCHEKHHGIESEVQS